MVHDGVFIIGGSCQLLILLVQEGHPVYCVASLVLVVLIEIDPIVIGLCRGCNLLFTFLQGYVRLSFLDLVQELGPFFVILLFFANLDPAGT